jgi:hypothetical protein
MPIMIGRAILIISIRGAMDAGMLIPESWSIANQDSYSPDILWRFPFSPIRYISGPSGPISRLTESAELLNGVNS